MPHVQLFVETADKADATLKAIEQDSVFREVAQAEQGLADTFRNKESTIVDQTLAASRLDAATEREVIYRIGKFFAEGYINVLRIGTGVEKSGIGWVEDGLRALTIAAPFAKSLGLLRQRRVLGLAAAVDVDAKLANCAWVAAARGARLAGQKLYATIDDLAKAAGITLSETGGMRGVQSMLPLIEKIGVRTKSMTLPSRAGKILLNESSMADLANAAKNAKGSVIMFGVEYNVKITAAGAKAVIPNNHTMLARWGSKGLEIVDRTGDVYKSLAEVERGAVGRFADIAGIANGVVVPEIVIFENASLVPAFATVASITPGLMNLIGVEVLPALVRETTLSVGRPALPGFLAGAAYKGELPPGQAMAPKSDSPLRDLSYFTYVAKPGETLAKVAQTVYGDGGLWRPIREANPKVTNGNEHFPFGLEALGGLQLLVPSQI